METVKMTLGAPPLTPNSVRLASREEMLENWSVYPSAVDEDTIGSWKSNPLINQYLTGDTASSAYFLNGIEIYTSTKGEYFYLDISSFPASFFAYGDTAPVDELTPLPDEFLGNVHDLVEADRAVSPYGFRLVQIVYHDADHVMFTLYSEALQHYSVMERASFECIGADTHAQLAKRAPEPNTLAEPLVLVLDDDGNICRFKEVDTDA